MSSTIENLEKIKSILVITDTDYALEIQNIDTWFVLSTDTELNVWSMDGEVGVVLYPRDSRVSVDGYLQPDPENPYYIFVGSYEEFKDYFSM